jgi:putative Holliday junction resolvase
MIFDIADFKAALMPNTRLLGLDLGEKTIGLALSDTQLTIATPMLTLKRGKFAADTATINEILAHPQVGG